MTSPGANNTKGSSQGATKPRRRGRKREAQRWIDLLAVRCTRIPAAEGHRRWHLGKEQLKADAPELFEVVQALLDDIARTDPLLTMDEWRVRAVARSRRVEKLRAALG
jgi:hypothetical protein